VVETLCWVMVMLTVFFPLRVLLSLWRERNSRLF
jgi:hypothetical protein